MGNDGTKVLAATAAGIGITALILNLTKPAKAAAPGGAPVIDEDVRKALAAILTQQLDILTALGSIGTSLGIASDNLNNINQNAIEILKALGAPTEQRVLDYFEKNNETLQSGTPFIVHEAKAGKGALIWGIFQVDDPDVTLILQIDNLSWEFHIDTLNGQGISSPIPGVWLSQYDTTNSVYCLVFSSAGNLAGFPYNSRLIITLRYNGAGTATLNQARGVKWVAI